MGNDAQGGIWILLMACREPGNGLPQQCSRCCLGMGQLPGGRCGVPRSCSTRPCPRQLQAGKRIEFIMGDPGELGSFQDCVSPSATSVTLRDLVG